MKKLLTLSLLFVACAVQAAVEIRPYKEEDRDALMALAFQDPMNFFVGSSLVKKGLMTRDLFEAENKKGIESLFSDELRKKHVAVENGIIVGFVEFFKTVEPNLEMIKEQFAAQDLPFNEEQVLAAMPNIKRTKAESEEFLIIECVVVDKAHQRKGIGKKLVTEAERLAQELWPSVNRIQINTNADNENACKMFEALGYQEDTAMTQQLQLMEIVVYAKTIA